MQLQLRGGVQREQDVLFVVSTERKLVGLNIPPGGAQVFYIAKDKLDLLRQNEYLGGLQMVENIPVDEYQTKCRQIQSQFEQLSEPRQKEDAFAATLIFAKDRFTQQKVFRQTSLDVLKSPSQLC